MYTAVTSAEASVIRPRDAVRRVVAGLVVAAGLAWTAAAQAHPDLTGVWMAPFKVHSSGLPLMGGVTPWIAVSAGDPKDIKLPTLDEMSARTDAVVKANNGNPQGAVPPRPPPPLNDAGKAAAAAIDPKKEQQLELACYPQNVLSRINGGPIQIVQNEKAISIASEGGEPARVIFLDGRGQANAVPQWNGHSVGHWDGDVLKVETVAIRGDVFGGWPMSDGAKVLEEYSLSKDGKTLSIRATYEDPKYYREPVRKMVYLTRRPDLEVTDYTCVEGKADMIETVSKGE